MLCIYWCLIKLQNFTINRKSAYDLEKITNRIVESGVISATESESEESERFHFLLTPLTTPSLTFSLWSDENQIVGVGSRRGRINQSQCAFPRFVIGLVLPLLLAIPTTQFWLDHKRRSRRRNQKNQNAVFTGLFCLLHLESANWPLQKRNWRQCLCKILEWQTKSIMVCYGIFCSGQLAAGKRQFEPRDQVIL